MIGVPIDLADPDVFAPTPWESFTYDANDNAGRTHAAAAESYRDHWNTPASTEIDALGRAITVDRPQRPQPRHRLVRHPLDLRHPGQPDLPHRRPRPRGVPVPQRPRRALLADGQHRRRPPRHRPRRPRQPRREPRLQGRVHDWILRPPAPADPGLGPRRPRPVRPRYGNASSTATPATPTKPPRTAQRQRAHNLLGRPVAHYDEAGLVTVTDVDFKGNVLDDARQIIADAPILATYERAAADGWQVTPFRVDWQPAPGQTADRARG